jgi:predicted RNA binding protein YcfA (HicA-like mRNA interferase family)
MKASRLLAILQREPLAYSVIRQSGSHRRLESRAGYPPITFSFHARVTVGPRAVRSVLCAQVGMAEADALALL